MAQTRTTAPHGSDGDASEARIGGAARVKGRIHGEGNLVVEGHVEGSVTLSGNLTIAEGASVTSETVVAHGVTVAGSLEGNVAATGTVRLRSGARVRGDLRGNAVVIDEGARFTGNLDSEFDLPPELGGVSQGGVRGRAQPARR